MCAYIIVLTFAGHVLSFKLNQKSQELLCNIKKSAVQIKFLFLFPSSSLYNYQYSTRVVRTPWKCNLYLLELILKFLCLLLKLYTIYDSPLSVTDNLFISLRELSDLPLPFFQKFLQYLTRCLVKLRMATKL